MLSYVPITIAKLRSLTGVPATLLDTLTKEGHLTVMSYGHKAKYTTLDDYTAAMNRYYEQLQEDEKQRGRDMGEAGDTLSLPCDLPGRDTQAGASRPNPTPRKSRVAPKVQNRKRQRPDRDISFTRPVLVPGGLAGETDAPNEDAR